uniref:FBA_2 domain-containing protein n=2 Tax=Caenorhabditis tropicalis TaxID=1561998 RepID=A0A1I7T398_9PELO
MEDLIESIQLEFLSNYQVFHRHQTHKTSENEEVTKTEKVSVTQLPRVLYPNGVKLPEKRDGEMPLNYGCPILTDFLMLKNSDCNPLIFLYDVDVFTTISSIRSLIYQWINDYGPKSLFFKKNLHYCHRDHQGRVFLNAGTHFTVPFERSTSFLNRFTILDHGQTWEEFVTTSYSGLAKMELKNGIRVAFTYKMYAQSDNQPIDIIIRSESSFRKEIDFHFLNCFLTKKKLWRYECHKNSTVFKESTNAKDLWNRLTKSQQMKITDCFANRLPEFLIDVAYGIESEEVVNVIRSVTSSEIEMIEKPYLDTLY